MEAVDSTQLSRLRIVSVLVGVVFGLSVWVIGGTSGSLGAQLVTVLLGVPAGVAFYVVAKSQLTRP